MKFRPNVAAVIINEENLVLAGERTDVKDAWQIPQGGVDDGETTETALWREIFEETGITREHLRIERTSKPVRYIFPGKVKRGAFDGQEQIYFLLKVIKPIFPKTSDEFRNYRWVTAEYLTENIVNFKKEAYKAAFEELFGKKF